MALDADALDIRLGEPPTYPCRHTPARELRASARPIATTTRIPKLFLPIDRCFFTRSYRTAPAAGMRRDVASSIAGGLCTQFPPEAQTNAIGRWSDGPKDIGPRPIELLVPLGTRSVWLKIDSCKPGEE